MTWLKYILASLIGFAATVIIAAPSAALILWLTIDRFVEWSCRNASPQGDCASGPILAWIAVVVIGCILVGLFVGTFVGTAVGTALYRKGTTAEIKKDQ